MVDVDKAAQPDPSERGENEGNQSYPDGSPSSTPFDYDATAEASLSEPPATSESASSYEPTGHSGPGWDTYSGVGNGPGWGTTPTYPPPSTSDTAGQPIVNEGYPPPATYPGTPQQQGHPQPGYPPYENPQQYPGQPYPGQQYPGQPYSDQPYPGQQYPGQPYSGQPYPGQPYPGQQYSGQPYPGQQYSGQPYPGQQYSGQPYPNRQSQQGPPVFGADPDAPYGRDPITGEPLSNKSTVVAGVLQVLLGWLGIGRFYIGSRAIAVGQVTLFVLGVLLSLVFPFGLLVLFGLLVWGIVDGAMILVGNVKDEQGRKLRD